jgi:hypothetical protein
VDGDSDGDGDSRLRLVSRRCTARGRLVCPGTVCVVSTSTSGSCTYKNLLQKKPSGLTRLGGPTVW